MKRENKPHPATSYVEIKKGIKRAEYDKIKFKSYSFCCLILGVFVGYISHNIILGLLAWFIPGLITARKYFEINKTDDEE